MADEGVDEVKVFRTTDDAVDDDAAEDQLYADKQDVAAEAEIEEASTIQSNSSFSHFPTPSAFPAMSPVAPQMSPYYSPSYHQQLAALNMVSPAFSMYTNMMAQAAQQQQRFLMNSFKTPDPSSLQSNGAGPIRTAKASKENRIREEKKQRPLIKKPLNAYMIFMKENRHKILEEEGNASKQSAEINAILGKKWQSMTEEDQKVYFEMANKEKEEHARKYPGWSARDNYAIHKKKKVRRVERNNENMESKKCRARFGIDNVEQWCRHCKRKKRCLNVDGEGNGSEAGSDDSPPTPGSGGDLPEPDVKPSTANMQSPSLSSTIAAAQQMQNFMNAGMGGFSMGSPFGFAMNGMSPFPFQNLMAFNHGMNQPIIHPSSIPRQDDSILRSSNSNTDSVKNETQ